MSNDSLKFRLAAHDGKELIDLVITSIIRGKLSGDLSPDRAADLALSILLEKGFLIQNESQD